MMRLRGRRTPLMTRRRQRRAWRHRRCGGRVERVRDQESGTTVLGENAREMTRQTTMEEPGFASQLDLFAPLHGPPVVARPGHLRPGPLPRIRQPEIKT